MLMTVTVALAFAMAVPTAGWARAELTGWSGAGCSIEIGVRLCVSLEEGAVCGAVTLPGVELLKFTLEAPDAVRWGIPIVTIVADIANARTKRPSSGS
jgi:hypothetical protein